MSTHPWIDRICVIVTVLSLIVTVLFMNGEKLGIEVISDTDAEAYAGSEYFTANDLNGVIELNGDSAKITGNGAYWLDGSLVIARTGQYVISGELTDGNIVVDAAKYSKVWILLNGVNITCSEDACLRIDQADKVFLTLAEGSENTLTGGTEYSETALADGTNAVIFSHDDLTINGSGSLTVLSSYMNGITSKDDLTITGGVITVTAPHHGIRVNDRFRFTSALLTISAGQDGIHTEGEIIIQDGTVTITADDDAIHSDTSFLLLGGTILINDCYEGIEAVTIEISGGDTTIHARDDGLNANGNTGVDFGGGMDLQNQLPGMAGSMSPQGFNTETFSGSDSDEIISAQDTWILISGGSLTILNESGIDADGLDSNGNITITGGTVLVSLTGSGGNSALDYGSESGGVALISGGTVLACGDSGMAENFSSDSAQASILYSCGSAVAAGSAVILLDAEGNELLSETVPYSFSSALISCPEMTVGETYTLRIGDTEETIELSSVTVTAGESASAYSMMPGNMGADNQGMMMPGNFGDGNEGMTMPGNFSDGNEGMMMPGSFGDGETPPERPEGAEDFTPPTGDGATFSPPTGDESFTPPTGEAGVLPSDGGFGDFNPFETAQATAEQTADAGQAETDSAFPWILVLISALCLALGVTIALLFKGSALMPTDRGTELPSPRSDEPPKRP